MKKVFSCFLALGLLISLHAQPHLQPASSVESAGFSAQRLDRINQLIVVILKHDIACGSTRSGQMSKHVVWFYKIAS